MFHYMLISSLKNVFLFENKEKAMKFAASRGQDDDILLQGNFVVTGAGDLIVKGVSWRLDLPSGKLVYPQPSPAVSFSSTMLRQYATVGSAFPPNDVKITILRHLCSQHRRVPPLCYIL